MSSYLLERAIQEAKRKKLGAQWMIVGEGGVAQAVKPSSIEVRTKQTSVPAIQVRN